MSTLFRVPACLSGSQKVCPAPVARASHDHTLINVNPFSCICVTACLRHASGTLIYNIASYDTYECLWRRQARRHTEKRKRVDIYKSVSVACTGTLNVHDRMFVTQAGRQAGTRKGLTFIRVEDVKDPPPPQLEKNRPGMKLRKTNASFWTILKYNNWIIFKLLSHKCRKVRTLIGSRNKYGPFSSVLCPSSIFPT